eukprot:3012813-Rhodomonas_salina.1
MQYKAKMCSDRVQAFILHNLKDCATAWLHQNYKLGGKGLNMTLPATKFAKYFQHWPDFRVKEK